MNKPLRIGLTLLLTGLALAYLVWKIDLGETVDTLLDASPWWFALSVGDHDRHRAADGPGAGSG